MRIRIVKMLIENFKGIHKKEVEFSNVTNIRGMNASGKTTIADAFSWLMFNKDSHGIERFQIRPLDADGQPVHNIEIKVSAILNIDGKEVEIIKVQKEDWVKKRGTNVTELQGNPNEYTINTIPKTEKDYKAYIAEMIGEELFKQITSPTVFALMEWKKQREILMKLVKGISDYDLAATLPKFVGLSKELNNFTLEELISKAKKALLEYKKTQVELPARIDEANRQIVHSDLAEVELYRGLLKSQLADLDTRENDIEKTFSLYSELGDRALALKFEISDLEAKANADLLSKRKTIARDGINLEQMINENNSLVQHSHEAVLKRKESNTQNNALLETTRNEWRAVKAKEFDESAWVFDESSLTCSMCGQELPSDKKEQLITVFETRKEKEKQSFNSSKMAQLETIVQRGNNAKAAVETAEKEIASFTDEIEVLNETILQLTAELEAKNKELSSLPSFVDTSSDSVIVSKKAELATIEEKRSQMIGGADLKQQIKAERQRLNDELLVQDKKIASADNTKIEQRIEELEEEQKTIGQLVADQEQWLFLIEEFTREKMNQLSVRINGKFKTVNFKLFKEQLNGGMTECCECTVNGVSYSDLNSGHRIVAGLDIISTLSEMYSVSAPIFVDNAEGINDFNIPLMDAQMILLSVSDDKELVVD